MELNERQYDRIARWFDGEDIELTEAERRVAEQIRRDEDSLRATIGVFLSAEAADRVRRRVMAGAARPGRRFIRIVWSIAGTAAAAALIMLAVALWPSQNEQHSTLAETDTVPIEVLIQVMSQTPANGEMDALDQQLDELEAEILGTLDLQRPGEEIDESWFIDLPSGPAKG